MEILLARLAQPLYLASQLVPQLVRVCASELVSVQTMELYLVSQLEPHLARALLASARMTALYSTARVSAPPTAQMY